MKLRETVKAERRYSGPDAELNLVEVYRDGNVYQEIPEDTWYIAFGWYMHDIFGKSFNIPFHPNLRRILLSVFVRYPEMLTPDAIAYLKKYGPVGCRDWQSVALLRAVGVPAFFSGCLTTTVDTLFPTTDPDHRSGTLLVDWMQGGKGPKKKQTVTAIRDKSFPENLELARSWVGDYAYKHSRAPTSRLHANLPARSSGSQGRVRTQEQIRLPIRRPLRNQRRRIRFDSQRDTRQTCRDHSAHRIGGFRRHDLRQMDRDHRSRNGRRG